MAKTPKHTAAEVAENSLIGGIFKMGMQGLDAQLTHDSFVQPALSHTFKAAQSIYFSGHQVNPESVAVEAAALGLMPIDVPTLLSLRETTEVTSESDLTKVSSSVVRFHQLRSIQDICRETYVEARSLKHTPAELSDRLQGKLTAAVANSDSRVRDSRDVCFEVAQESLRRMESGELPGFPMGLPAFDDYLLRWIPGRNYIIAGRPGVGKTSFVLGEAINASKYGVILLCSAEMTEDELAQRELSYRTGVSFESIVTGKLTPQQATDIIGCADQIAPGRVYINDMVHGLHGIRSHARRLKAQADARGLPFLGIILDYLQLVADFGTNREQAVAQISAGMKNLAKELKCTTFVLSQLNRDSVKGEDKRPQVHHLRDSGSIEQDANAIIFIHRESLYDNNAPPDEAELIIAKNRSGKRGTVYCGWDGKRTKFFATNGHTASQAVKEGAY